MKIDQFQGSVKLKVESANGPRFDIQFFLQNIDTFRANVI